MTLTKWFVFFVITIKKGREMKGEGVTGETKGSSKV
jgi:hypothetical protein